LIDSKAGVLDIKALINNNSVIDIEMQVEDEHNMEHRSAFYMVSTSSQEFKKGEFYVDLKKTIVINLLNFNYFERNSYMHIAHMKFEKSNPENFVDMGYKVEQELATADLEMIFIELPKFIKKNPGVNPALYQWLWLLAGREDKVKMADKELKEIKKTIEVIDEMSADPKEWEAYESRRRAIMNYNSGMEASRREGLEEGEKIRH
jgi:predicted transposase/invertase (TIGR01784 family)